MEFLQQAGRWADGFWLDIYFPLGKLFIVAVASLVMLAMWGVVFFALYSVVRLALDALTTGNQ
jgi:hypothetical protein